MTAATGSAGWPIVRSLSALLLLTLAGACAASQSEPAAGGAEAPLLSSMQVYTAGDTVTFVLQVTNTTTSPLELEYPNGQSFDFVVRQGDRVVWRWGQEQMFSQALRRERVGGGETLRHQASWVPGAVSGQFTAIGSLTASNVEVSQATQFELP